MDVLGNLTGVGERLASGETNGETSSEDVRKVMDKIEESRELNKR